MTEYRNHTLTRIFNDSPRHGCYSLAILVFILTIIRNALFYLALTEQPTVPLLPEPYATLVPLLILFLGQLFVISSGQALGITGTYLGDYFGILMDQRVTGYVICRLLVKPLMIE